MDDVVLYADAVLDLVDKHITSWVENISTYRHPDYGTYRETLGTLRGLKQFRADLLEAIDTSRKKEE